MDQKSRKYREDDFQLKEVVQKSSSEQNREQPAETVESSIKDKVAEGSTRKQEKRKKFRPFNEPEGEVGYEKYYLVKFNREKTICKPVWHTIKDWRSDGRKTEISDGL